MNKAKILIIEDEPAVLELEKNLLKRMGYVVCCASSAEQGYQLIKQEQPDAIVLDVMLAGKDGYSLARKIKTVPELARIPIIFVSAKDEPADMIEGFAAGGKVYLTKPFTERSLETAVRTLLLAELK